MFPEKHPLVSAHTAGRVEAFPAGSANKLKSLLKTK
jgi:hypothetical protein